MLRTTFRSSHPLQRRFSPSFIRRFATLPPSPPPPTLSRLARLESRLPRFLRHLTTPLRTAPLSHITSFLLLHELTAILPLVGLTAFFHYSNWLPPYISEGKWVHEGTQKFGKYLRKKGWLKNDSRGGKWFGKGEGGVRIVVELATAWAVVKLLLPVRLVVSVWGTPCFARWTVAPVAAWVGRSSAGVWVGRLFGRGKVVEGGRSAGAGTGATGVGVLPTEVVGKAK